MNQERFTQVVHDQLRRSELLLDTKGEEYNKETDRLAFFTKAAALQGETPAQALFGMLAKHLVSLSDMCQPGVDSSMDRWLEKITDSINYLILLRALVEEEEATNE